MTLVSLLQIISFRIAFPFLILFFINQETLFSQADLESARQLAFAGEHMTAEEQLTSLLEQNPDWLAAKVLKAHNYAWWKKYDLAILSFEQLTKEVPTLTEAWIGLGYSYLWSGKRANAVFPFKKAIALTPENKDAQKGLGYVYLADENGEGALTIFSRLSLAAPKDTEYLVALGRAYVLYGDRPKAQEYFKRALEINPQHADARYFLALMEAKTKQFNVDLWGGFSRVNEDSRFGLRQLQLFYQPNKKVGAYARYDNSLSLDNIEFITLKEEVEAIAIGSILAWNDRLASRLEYGLRFFPVATQQLLSVEQVYYFPSSAFSIKAGGYLGVSPKLPTEWYTYAGIHIPISKIFSLDPTYFYGRNEGESDAQQRFLLSGLMKFNTGYELLGGIYYGTTNIEISSTDQTVEGGYLQARFPIHKILYGQFAVNYETNPFQDVWVGAFGIQLRFRQ